MEKYSICVLDEKFYKCFPAKDFPEILRKGEKRPYLILLVKINGKNYGIPFRSNINHKYCFRIINDRNLKEGLDYTKSVVLKSEDIGRTAHVRPGTIPQIDQFIDIIIRDFTAFLKKYEKIRMMENPGKTERMILNNCTLKYFEK